jgi:hypothetical protein
VKLNIRRKKLIRELVPATGGIGRGSIPTS